MKRTATLALLLVVSTAAGVWLFRPSPERPHAAESCEASGTCSAPEVLPAERPTGQSPTAATPEPPRRAAPAAPVAAAEVPADAAQLRNEADRLLAEGQIPDAIVALRRATAADPSARNHGDLGELLAKVLNLDEALIHLRKAAELEPKNADRWITLANAYYRKVDPGKAWAAEKRAKEADPGLVLGFDESGNRVRKPGPSGSDSSARKP